MPFNLLYLSPVKVPFINWHLQNGTLGDGLSSITESGKEATTVQLPSYQLPGKNLKTLVEPHAPRATLRSL